MSINVLPPSIDYLSCQQYPSYRHITGTAEGKKLTYLCTKSILHEPCCLMHPLRSDKIAAGLMIIEITTDLEVIGTAAETDAKMRGGMLIVMTEGMTAEAGGIETTGAGLAGGRIAEAEETIEIETEQETETEADTIRRQIAKERAGKRCIPSHNCHWISQRP